MSVWSDAFSAAAKLARRMADIGYSASRVRDVPEERLRLMRHMLALLRRDDAEAFNEAICTDYAQHAANGIAEIVELQAEVEAERANRPIEDDEPTPVVPQKGEP